MRSHAGWSTFHMYNNKAELPTVANFSYCSKSNRAAGAPRPRRRTTKTRRRKKKKRGRKYKTKPSGLFSVFEKFKSYINSVTHVVERLFVTFLLVTSSTC